MNAQERYYDLKDRNVCVQCGRQTPETLQGRTRCKACAKTHREAQEPYNAKRVVTYRERKAAGVCTRCGGKRDGESLMCSFCRAKQSLADKRYKMRRTL